MHIYAVKASPSISDFADYLVITSSSYSQWKKRTRTQIFSRYGQNVVLTAFLWSGFSIQYMPNK